VWKRRQIVLIDRLETPLFKVVIEELASTNFTVVVLLVFVTLTILFEVGINKERLWASCDPSAVTNIFGIAVLLSLTSTWSFGLARTLLRRPAEIRGLTIVPARCIKVGMSIPPDRFANPWNYFYGSQSRMIIKADGYNKYQQLALRGERKKNNY
jgi:hypothetical protein